MQTSTLMKPLMILCLLSLLFDSVQTIDDFLCGSVGQCNCRFGGPGDVLLVACNLVSMERLPVECDAVHKEVDLSDYNILPKSHLDPTVLIDDHRITKIDENFRILNQNNLHSPRWEFQPKNTQLAIYNISKVSNIEPIVNGFQIAGRPVTLLYVNGAHRIDIKGLEKLVWNNFKLNEGGFTAKLYHICLLNIQGASKPTEFTLPNSAEGGPMKNVVIKNINKNILFRLNSSYLSINADDHMSNRLIFHECSIDRLYEARLTDGGGTPDLVLFSETTSQDTTKVFTYPILSEFDHKFHPNLMLYIARVDAGQGAHILPRDYLYGVSKFDKFVLGSLPQRVDFGALGITELKFNWFWYECIINDETKLCGNFQVDKQTNEVWQQMKCHQIKNSRICQLCFLQFYGLHSKKDRVIQRCENKDEPKNLQVVKCTYDCPRMYDGVSDQQFADDFAGYVICDTKHQVAQSCYKNGTAKFQLRESKVGSKQSEEGPTNLLDPIKSPGDEAIEDPPGGNIQSNGSANNLEKDGNVLDFDDRGKNLCHLRSLSHQIMLTSVLIFF